MGKKVLQRKTSNLDCYVKELIILERLQNRFKLENRGPLQWTTFYDGEHFTINVEYLDNEF